MNFVVNHGIFSRPCSSHRFVPVSATSSAASSSTPLHKSMHAPTAGLESRLQPKKCETPARYSRLCTASAAAQPAGSTSSTSAPCSASISLEDVKALSTAYDIVYPGSTAHRNRLLARKIKLLAAEDPFAYTLFKQDGKDFVTGLITAAEFRERYVSMFGVSQSAELIFLDMAMVVPRVEQRWKLLQLAPDVHGFMNHVLKAQEAALIARKARRDELLAAWQEGLIDGDEALAAGLAELDDEEEEGQEAGEQADGVEAWDLVGEEAGRPEDPRLKGTYMTGWRSMDREYMGRLVSEILATQSDAQPSSTTAQSPPTSPSPQAAHGLAQPVPTAASSTSSSTAEDSSNSDGGGGALGALPPATRRLRRILETGVDENSISSKPARKLPGRRSLGKGGS